MSYYPGIANHVTGEVPSGTVDGANKDFTTAHTPKAGSVAAYVGIGTAIRLVAFTLSGSTVSFTVAPALTALIYLDYRW